MSNLTLFCRNATTFAKDGAFDEDAFRQFLQRFVDVKMGVYLASTGSGESNAMTEDELLRLYQVGVEVCKGKVPVNGNPPEQPTVREALRHIMLAIKGGVEVVNIYGPPGWHAYRPTDEEYVAFFDEVLPQVKHPVALTPNPIVGYVPKPAIIADLCHRYHQVVAVNLNNQTDDFFINLKDSLKREIPIYAPFSGSLHMLMLGARGVIGGELNMLPKTYREYFDLYESGKFIEAAHVYADIKRFSTYVAKWHGAHPRWIKMMMKVFKFPGCELRKPYRMPGADELQRFTDGLLRLRLPEIDELARTAGLNIPA